MAIDSGSTAARNPRWSRDELITTLDFYLTHAPTIPGKSSKDIASLSEFLNKLRAEVGMRGEELFSYPQWGPHAVDEFLTIFHSVQAEFLSIV